MRRFLILLSAFVLVGCTAAGDETVPLPRDVKISAPADGVPDAARRFLGTWGPAKWDGDKLPHILVVEKVAPDGEAQVVYAYGRYRGWNIDAGGWYRETGRIDGNRLAFQFSNGASVAYEMNHDSTLSGRYEIGGDVATIRLARAAER